MTGPGLLDFEAQQAITAQLAPDERLLWAGSPRRGLRFQATDVFIVPFSLLWTAFALFWEYTVIQSGAPLFMRLWGIPFILIGVHLMVGRFFTDALQRRRARYGLTTRRALIVLGRNVQSFNLTALPDIVLSERADGSGSISFGSINLGSWRIPASTWPSSSRARPPAFEAIENVRLVHDMLLRAQHDLASERK